MFDRRSVRNDAYFEEIEGHESIQPMDKKTPFLLSTHRNIFRE